MEGILPRDYPFPEYADELTRVKVLETITKMYQHFGKHDKIQVSYSGGSDSDCIVHLICKYFPEHIEKCSFVFVNTGLEYAATKKHIADTESKYGITIDRIRGESVVTACRKRGFPILSKFKSHFLDLYLRGKPSGERIIFGDGIKSYHAMQFTENQKKLALYLKENGIMVSDYCCEISKKKPLLKYQKQKGFDMIVTGERSAEGGRRALIHKSCFEACNSHAGGADKYMPLFWWDNDTKEDFKRSEDIKYSDCYEKYGMKRTGCCGCPFNLNVKDDLQAMHEFEPQLFKACMHVFGEAYRLTDMFQCRRKKCLPEFLQYTITGEIERSV